MTYEEAQNLYNSNEFQEIICHSKLCNYANTGCSDCKITHMNILINEALEKQIPKKPVEERYFGEMGSKIGFCPNCHTGQSCDDNSIQYCYYCSQAIDWSDEHDV